MNIPLKLTALRRTSGPLQQFLLVISLLLMLLIVVLIAIPKDRSFLVEARTGAVSLTMGAGTTAWRLPQTVRCVPLAVPSRVPDPVCGLAAAAASDAAEDILIWAPGTQLSVLAQQTGLQITVTQSGSPDLPDGTVLIVSQDGWADAGALTFRAAAVLGEDMATGAQGYLKDGTWEARETGLMALLGLRAYTEVVKSGRFTTGTRIGILNDGAPAQVYGHIVPGADGTMIATLISEPGQTALSVTHFGLAQAVLLKPDWMDTTISSPLILALGVLLTLLAAGSQILSDSWRQRKEHRQAAKVPPSTPGNQP